MAILGTGILNNYHINPHMTEHPVLEDTSAEQSSQAVNQGSRSKVGV